MDVCRACLTTENNMNSINDFFVTSYNLLTNLHIALSDGMPQYFCENCAHTIKLFVKFREKALSADVMLQQILQGNGADHQLVKIEKNEDGQQIIIKKEIKLEIDEPAMSSTLFEAINDFCSDNIDYSEPEEIKVKMSTRSKSRKKTNGHNKKSKMSTKENKVKKNTIKDIKEQEQDSLLCGLCKLKFEHEDALTVHLETHKKVGICECGVCYETFMHWPQLFGHRLSHLPGKQRRCHICSKRYMAATYLEDHYLKTHYDGEDKSLKCNFCMRVYATPRKLTKHKLRSHSVKSFTCDYCYRSFRLKTELIYHIRRHGDFYENKESIKNYMCDQCGYSSNLRANLRMHQLRKHTPGKVTCPKCFTIFVSQEKFSKHICQEVNLLCPVCGKECATRKRLSIHLDSHSDVRKFKCSRCPATYKSRQALAVHLNRHDGNRTKVCEFCAAKFYCKSTLIKHRRIHTGEKPYVCKICDKGFTGNHNLKVHMQVHGEFLIVRRDKNKEDNDKSVPKNIVKRE